jgi:5-enolpyruvylshikimate-3-phosphate synthase
LQEWADYFDATVAGTSIRMTSANATNWDDHTITLTGNIHLELKDIDVEGRIASISQLE